MEHNRVVFQIEYKFCMLYVNNHRGLVSYVFFKLLSLVYCELWISEKLMVY